MFNILDLFDLRFYQNYLSLLSVDFFNNFFIINFIDSITLIIGYITHKSWLFAFSYSSILHFYLTNLLNFYFALLFLFSLHPLNFFRIRTIQHVLISWRYKISIHLLILSPADKLLSLFSNNSVLFFVLYSFCLTLKYFIYFYLIHIVWENHNVLLNEKSNSRLLNSIFNGIYETIWWYPIINFIFS